MSKYVQLININSRYAKRMKYLSNKIFGEVARTTDKKSMKVVKLFEEKPISKRSEIVDYYPRLKQTHDLFEIVRLYGLYRDEHEDFKEEFEKMRISKGKDSKSRKAKKESVTVLK
ncbi:PREDICTED: 28S ribosomal protein S33, mitochondrial [Ceratosolen solmsi marchali]|uniref:Small ribosomal subunit protein mS33 n=1 Tax=Ceratosolen solmsi marchali TaxID=326594 RepID=A0AAJ6YH48_9HYME|nr:PREDICTED: 28S ribosomal protein S33, mitochondrial [Ceratosolen solmsi marchali]